MRRRTVLFVSLVIAGCGSSKKTMDAVLPQQLAGGWTRGAVRMPAAEVPPAVSALGVEDSAEATYSGPAEVRVRAFRMKAETSAFEMIQKWRQTEGLAAYKGPYFFVANAPAGVTPAVVGELLRNLQSVTEPRA